MTRVFNKEVFVTSYYFTQGKGFHSFPRSVQFENQELTFIETGLRCLVQKGQDLIEIFNMSDGRTQYRLKFEPQQRSWTLLTSRAMV
jgi:hypothetical protein